MIQQEALATPDVVTGTLNILVNNAFILINTGLHIPLSCISLLPKLE